MVNLSYIRQEEPLGLGHAILQAKDYISEDFFSVLLGDDIFVSDEPILAKLISLHKNLNAPVIGVMEVPRKEVHKYCVVSVENEGGAMKIRMAIEKPSSGEAPSNLAIVGRYILPRDIFNYLSILKPSLNGEIQLTDAINDMIKDGYNFYALKIKDRRFDVGSVENWLKANIHFGILSGMLNIDNINLKIY